jgi:hypothetical protein
MCISTTYFGIFDWTFSGSSKVSLPCINVSFVYTLNLMMTSEIGQICRRIIENLLQFFNYIFLNIND